MGGGGGHGAKRDGGGLEWFGLRLAARKAERPPELMRGKPKAADAAAGV